MIFSSGQTQLESGLLLECTPGVRVFRGDALSVRFMRLLTNAIGNAFVAHSSLVGLGYPNLPI